MSEVHEKQIDEEYEKLMARLRGGLMYGIPFDEHNIRHLVIFAYYMGLMDEQRIHVERFDQMYKRVVP